MYSNFKFLGLQHTYSNSYLKRQMKHQRKSLYQTSNLPCFKLNQNFCPAQYLCCISSLLYKCPVGCGCCNVIFHHLCGHNTLHNTNTHKNNTNTIEDAEINNTNSSSNTNAMVTCGLFNACF